MALVTAQGIAKVAIPMLTRALVLPRTVTRVAYGEFTGGNGDTITVRVPQPATAREQVTPGAAIVYDDMNEEPVEVTFRHLYHATHITDEQASFEIIDFAAQITRPQVDAVARGAEDQLVDVMNALPTDATIDFAASATEADTLAGILAGRSLLGQNNAPAGDRWCAVSSTIAGRILSISTLLRVNESGSEEALRRANIGTLFGLNFIEVPALNDDTMIMYHSSAFVWANGAPPNPKGATESYAVNEQGISLRQIFQYDPDHLQDASVVSTFAGAAAVYEDGATATDVKRWVKIAVAGLES